MKSVQETHAPNNRCFGCGPANEKGLRIRSFEQDGELVGEWHAEPHHQAFDGILNGGICGALLDCHSNWAAAMHLMRKRGESTPPCTVTADFHVTLKRPTPLGPSTCTLILRHFPSLFSLVDRYPRTYWFFSSTAIFMRAPRNARASWCMRNRSHQRERCSVQSR